VTSENQNPPSSQEKPTHQTSETTAQIGQTATELQPPPSDSKREDTRETTKHWLDYVTFGLELLGLIVLCVYAGYTIKISLANEKAANAAKDAAIAAKQSADTAAHQLELAERPWVDAQVGIGGPLVFNVNGANITLKFDLLNSGHSPGLNAFIWLAAVDPFVTDNGNQGMIRQNVCEQTTRLISGFESAGVVGVALFPNRPLEQVISVAIPPAVLAKHKAPRPADILMPFIVACIGYQPVFDKKVVYHTSYIVDLFNINNSGQRSAAFKIDKDVSADRLVVKLHSTEAIEAD
jgi:hypothetical protein